MHAGEPKYWAFISYSHADRTWGEWLHKALERYRIPSRLVGRPTANGPIPRRLTPVFRDRDELPSSADLGTAIDEALRASRYQIVICSPRAAASKWVDAEVRRFKSLGRADRVICLIVDGEPNASATPGHEGMECFAPGLRFQVGAEGELRPERADPVAADAREEGDGRDNALLKVIAGLIGVGFDELRRRDQRRRTGFMVATAAVSLAVAAVTSALAFSAYQSRNEARLQTERVQRTKDFFVSIFANGDPLRRSDSAPLTLSGALDDAMRRVDTELASDPRLQGDLLDDFGEIRAGRGDLAGAKAMFQRALPLHEQTLAPYDPAIANTLVNLGAIENYMGHTLDGGPFLERAVAILERHADTEGNALSNARNGLASVYREAGRPELALAQMRKSLAYFRSNPGPQERRLGITLGSIGNLEFEMKDVESARRDFEECVAVIERNLGPESANLSDCLYGLSRVSAGEKDVAAEAAYAERAARIAEKSFPGDHPWRARAQGALGMARLDQGRAAEGELLLRDALAILDRAKASENRRLPFRIALAESRLHEHAPADAVAIADEGLAACRPDPKLAAPCTMLAGLRERAGSRPEGAAP